MRKLLLSSVIQQLLYYISRVESLIGDSNFIPIRGGEFPFLATFQYFPEERNFCEGALISDKYVITSAACLKNVTPESFRIIFEVAHAQEPTVVCTVDSWITYVPWAKKRRLSYDKNDPAIVKLTDVVNNINPVPLNELTKRQLDGSAAIMTGRKNDVLSKTVIHILSYRASKLNMLVLRVKKFQLEDRGLRASANPTAFLSTGDRGSPLLHARDKSLLGIAYGTIPSDNDVRANFSMEFIQRHQMNVYLSVDYYRSFIYNNVPAVPAA